MSSRNTNGKHVRLNGTVDFNKKETSSLAAENIATSKPNSWTHSKHISDVIRQKSSRGSARGVSTSKTPTPRTNSPINASGIVVNKRGMPPLCIDESDEVHVVEKDKFPSLPSSRDAPNTTSSSHQSDITSLGVPKNKRQVSLSKDNCSGSYSCSDSKSCGANVNRTLPNRDNTSVFCGSVPLQSVDGSDHNEVTLLINNNNNNADSPRSLNSCSSTSYNCGATGWNPITNGMNSDKIMISEHTPQFTSGSSRQLDEAVDMCEIRLPPGSRSVPCSSSYRNNNVGNISRNAACAALGANGTANSIFHSHMYTAETFYSPHDAQGLCESLESTSPPAGAVVDCSSCSTPRPSMGMTYNGFAPVGIKSHNVDSSTINDDRCVISPLTLPTQQPTEEEFIHARAIIRQAPRPILVALLTSLLDDFPTMSSLVTFRYETAMIALSKTQCTQGESGGLQHHHPNDIRNGSFLNAEEIPGTIGVHESQHSMERNNEEYQHQTRPMLSGNGVRIHHSDSGSLMTNNSSHYTDNVVINSGQSHGTICGDDSENQLTSHQSLHHYCSLNQQNSQDSQQFIQQSEGPNVIGDFGHISDENGTMTSLNNIIHQDGSNVHNAHHNSVGLRDINRNHNHSNHSSVFVVSETENHRNSHKKTQSYTCKNQHDDQKQIKKQLPEESSVVSATVASPFGLVNKMDHTINRPTTMRTSNGRRPVTNNHHTKYDNNDDYSLYQPELAMSAFHVSDMSSHGKNSDSDFNHRHNGSASGSSRVAANRSMPQYIASCGHRAYCDDLTRGGDCDVSDGLHGLDLDALLDMC